MFIESVMPPTISSSVLPFSSFLQPFPASGFFPMSHLFTSDGQSIGVSASVLPVNTQNWSPLGWTGWISLQSKGLSRVFSNTTVQKHQFFGAQLSLWSNSHIVRDYWKNHSFDYTDLSWQSDISAFLYMARFVIALLPKSKHLLISWLQSPSTVILEPKKTKSVTISTVSTSICHEVMGSNAMILIFLMQTFKPAFSPSSFTLIKRLFSSSLSALRMVLSAYLRFLIFLPVILIPACASSSLVWCILHIS